MKATLAFLTVLGLTGAVFVNGLPTQEAHATGVSRGLTEDLEDFLKLIPQEKILDLFYEYLNEDEEFGEAIEYVMSKEFTDFIIDVENMPEVREMLDYLQKAGLDAYGYVNKINRYLEIPEISRFYSLRSGMKITGGLSGFIKDVKALIPKEKLEKLYQEKLKTSKDFAALVQKLSSPEFQSLVDKVMAKPKLQEIIRRLESKHVDVNEFLDLLTSLLGVKFHRPAAYFTKSLHDDLEDFMKLIPHEQITDLFYEYLNNDEEFAEAMEYVMSEEFKSFVVEIESMPEVRKGLDYLQNAGLDAYGFVNKINHYLGLPPISHGFRLRRSVAKITGGINGFIKDVKALLPMDKLKKLYEEKLKTSKDFAALIQKLSSPEFQSLVNKIMAMPKMQEIIKKLKGKNVDVQELFDLLTSMLGLKFPKPAFYSAYYAAKSLHDDLEDFMKLIPQEQITDLFYEYLNNDEEFAEAMEYVMSEEFKNFVVEIESMPEVRKGLDYLQNAGLDAYGFVNKINHYLGLPPISHGFRLRSLSKITGGINGFIKDVKALLPMDKLKKLYEEKLKTSKDFAALIQKLSSPEFQSLVNKIMAMPKMQEIIKKLKGKNVDVQEIFDLLTSMLGLKFPKPAFYAAYYPAKNLHDDLEDFMKLIPENEITDLFYEYLNEDEEFGETIDYIMSNEFTDFVVEIENMPEVREMLNYLEKAGLDAYGFVNMINRYLEIPEISPFFSLRSMKITGGLSGFIKDVKALLPMDKLKKLYEDKLKTSKDFAALIHKLSSPEFESLVRKIMAKPKMKEIINRLEKKNVNVQEILDLLTSLIGIKFPKPF